jgi:hypothetical protein
MRVLKKLKNMKITTSLFFILILTSCSTKQEFITNPSSSIESAYFQNWVGGQELTGGGTNLFLKFKTPLKEGVFLSKVYFQEKEIVPEKRNETDYVARFSWKPDNKNLIMDGETVKEYGNKAPEINKPRFNLMPSEAVLEFNNNCKIEYYKLVAIKEKELLAYPSTRPRN